MCLKEILFLYIGLRYILDDKETFELESSAKTIIDEAISICNEGIVERAATVISRYITDMDNVLPSSCYYEIIDKLKEKLNSATPYNEKNPENIFGYYRPVINQVEEICMKCGISQILPKKECLERNIRYIGVVKYIAEENGVYVNLISRDAKNRILQLGHNRYERKKTIYFPPGILREEEEDDASYLFLSQM